MARVKIESVVHHLDREFRLALQDAIGQHIPDADYNINALYATFERAVYNRCSTWERVPDNYVEEG